MAINPTIFIDGDKRRIYEVPNLSSFVVDGSGFRIYTPISLVGRVDEFVKLNFQEDVWSDFQDWHILNEWSTIAIDRDGGSSKGIIDTIEVFATIEFRLLTSIGWLFVPADYAHVLEIFGNVQSNEQDVTLFDSARITSAGVVSGVRMADSLQTIIITSGSGLSVEQTAQLLEIYIRLGLDPTNAFTDTETLFSDANGVIEIDITGDGEFTTTQTRRP